MFKKHFQYKIILVSHYTNWSFALLGNYIQLKKLLQKQRDDREKTIIKEFKEDIRMINKTDRLVCVAQHTSEVFRKLGNIQPTKIEIINNALEDGYNHLSDKENLALRIKYCIREDEKLIIFAGRLDEVKGVACLIRAFRKILTNYPGCRLIIAGDGNYNEWLKEAENCWTKITFTGRIDKKALYEFYNIADLGVVCSLHEEFGFVAIEMMMHALPVIVTKTGGLDEIVEDGVSGLKVPVRTVKGKRQADVKCLAEKISCLLGNPAYAKELGENGRKRFLANYELSIFAKKMLELYHTV